jgi:integrase/recombinase XerD
MARKDGPAPAVPKEAFERVLDAQSGRLAQRNWAVLYASHYLGLRAVELSRLTIGDLWDGHHQDLRRHIRLKSAYTKGKKFRSVPLASDEARKILKDYVCSRLPCGMDEPLFLSQKGGAFSPNTLQRMVKNLYRRAGVEGSSHSGRRSFATRLITAGVDIYRVKVLMGHASIQTTQRYFDTSDDLLEEAVRRLD